MVTFSPTVAPSYNSPKKKDFRVNTAPFGDGYKQRVGDGIQRQVETWQLSWNLLSTAEADDVTDFFDARDGTDSFDWTTPDGDVKKFFVSNYNRTPIAHNSFSVSASLEEDQNQ